MPDRGIYVGQDGEVKVGDLDAPTVHITAAQFQQWTAGKTTAQVQAAVNFAIIRFLPDFPTLEVTVLGLNPLQLMVRS